MYVCRHNISHISSHTHIHTHICSTHTHACSKYAPYSNCVARLCYFPFFLFRVCSCTEVITTPASSFGYIATALGAVTPVTVTKWGKCVRARAHTHTHTHTHTHIHTRTYTRTHTHARAHAPNHTHIQ